MPAELDVPTTEVRLEVPEGFEVTNVSSPSGWQGNLSGRSIVWSGGEISPDEIQEFAFEARTPEEAGEFRWRAFQTYEDGTVVEWTGAEDSEEPAPVVNVTSAGGASGMKDEHQHGEKRPPRHTPQLRRDRAGRGLQYPGRHRDGPRDPDVVGVAPTRMRRVVKSLL